jgi:hypothetical protein
VIVKEMLRRLRVSLNDTTEPYQISTDQLYLLLQGAYMGIQRKSTQWRFFHKRGLFFQTVVGKADYIKTNVNYINPDSIYIIEDGLTQRMPLFIKEYKDWVIEQATAVIKSQTPLYLIHTPPFEWKVEPIPDKVWNVYADYWTIPAEFIDENDEPIWAEEFHEIVLLEAMKPASTLRPETKEALLMNTQVATLLPGLSRSFANRYLNTTIGAGPLL